MDSPRKRVHGCWVLKCISDSEERASFCPAALWFLIRKGSSQAQGIPVLYTDPVDTQ